MSIYQVVGAYLLKPIPPVINMSYPVLDHQRVAEPGQPGKLAASQSAALAESPLGSALHHLLHDAVLGFALTRAASLWTSSLQN